MEQTKASSDTLDLITGISILKTLEIWLLLGAVIGTTSWYVATALEPSVWKTAQMPTVLVVAEGYVLLPIVILLRYGGLSGLRDRIKLRYTGLKDIGLAGAIFVGLAVILLLLYMAMGAVSGSFWHPGKELIRDATDMSRLPTANVLTWALILVRVFLLAGLAEELLFRGLLFGWLRQKYAVVPTILMTALLFTAEHIYLVIFPAAFIYGLAIGWCVNGRVQSCQG